MTTPLGLFNTQLIRFFEDLSLTYPEERDIKSALEMIKFAKASNPKLVLDMYYEYVHKPLNKAVIDRDADYIITYARAKISSEFNEISPGLVIFEKYWHTMTDNNRESIWNYMRVLGVLCSKIHTA